MGVLNDFYTLMVDTTAKNDGIVDKFLGDGVMAIFGAPIVHADHAAAIKLALACRRGWRISRRRARGQGPDRRRDRREREEAVAGTVGTEDRMEYTVIGDSVNLAARLESNAKPGQILISHRTHQKIDGLVNVRTLGAIRVKQGRAGRGLRGPQSGAERVGHRCRRRGWLSSDGGLCSGSRWGCSPPAWRRRRLPRAPRPTAAPRTRRDAAHAGAGPSGSGGAAPRGVRVRGLRRDAGEGRGTPRKASPGDTWATRPRRGWSRTTTAPGDSRPAEESCSPGARGTCRACSRAGTSWCRSSAHNLGPQTRGRLLMSASAFEEQMRYLKREGYHVITLRQFLEFATLRRQLPRKTVVLTFDDGWKSFRELAYPILKSSGFRPRCSSTPTSSAPGSRSRPELDLATEGFDIQAHSSLTRTCGGRRPSPTRSTTDGCRRSWCSRWRSYRRASGSR